MSIQEDLQELQTEYWMNGTLAEEDLSRAELLLYDDDPHNVAHAAMFFTSLSEEMIVYLSRQFNKYPDPAQRILIPLMCVSQNREVYDRFFDMLKTTKDHELAAIILVCLARSDYATFPIWLEKYTHAKGQYQRRLELIIKYMGPKKLGPILALFPVIPHESLFREMFGNEFIDDIYE